MHVSSPDPGFALPARDAGRGRGPAHPTRVGGGVQGFPAWMGAQLWWPLLAFALANLVLIVDGGDQWLAGHVYAWEGGRWALRESFVTAQLIHVGGKRLSTLAWLAVAAAAIVAGRRPQWRAWRGPLLQLALSVLAATMLVSLLKAATHMDCPWDLQAYGGPRPFFGLFTARPSGLRASGCFPAGHASAGYAWVALYFLFLRAAPRWRWHGLGIGIGLGLLFGISQQVRGAHFLSHDLCTLMLCWLAALAIDRLAMRAADARRGRLS